MGRLDRYSIYGAKKLLWTITTFMATVMTFNETLLMRCNKCVTALTVNC